MFYFLLILLSGGAFCAVRLGRRIEETLAPTAAGFILLLFALGTLRMVDWGFPAVAALSALLWLAAARRSANWRRCFFTPGLAGFLIGYTLFFFLMRGRLFYNWDDFSHWGAAARELFVSGLMPCFAPAKFMFPAYPAGGGLFEFLALKSAFAAEFDEGIYNFAPLVLTLCATVGIMRFSEWNRPWQALGQEILVLAVPLLFFPNFFSGYMDCPLGALFAAGVLAAMFRKRNDKVTTFVFLPVLAAVLPLIKPSGLGFALGLTIFAAALGSDDKRSRVTEAAAMLAGVLAVKLTLIALCSGIEVKSLGNEFSFKALYLALFHNEPDYAWTSLRNSAFAAFCRMSPAGVFLPPAWYAVLLGVVVWKTGKRRAATLLTGFTLLFVLLLALSYLFDFVKYDAVNLGSFDRYIGTLTMAFSLAALAALFRKRDARTLRLALALVFLGGAVRLAAPLTELWQWERRVAKYRLPMETGRAALNRVLRPGETFTVIDQGGVGWSRIVFHYYFGLERYKMDGLYSLGGPQYEDDVWTVAVSPDDWLAQLKREGVDYVWVQAANPDFRKKYGLLFTVPPEDRTLYRVTAAGGFDKL